MPEKEISRRDFLRRASYFTAGGSAILIGGGVGIVKNVNSPASDEVQESLKFNNITQEQRARSGTVFGGLMTAAGICGAYASYILHERK